MSADVPTSTTAPPESSVGDAGHRAEPARIDGLRAKAAYLIGALTGGDSTPAERAASAVALLANLDELFGALDRESADALVDALVAGGRAASEQCVWSTTLLPSDAVVGPDAIEGTNVRRVAAPTDGTGLVVARFTPPAGHRVAVVSECSVEAGGLARLELVEAPTGAPVAASTLGDGLHQHVELALDAVRPIELELRVSAIGRADVWWYGASVSAWDENARQTAPSAALRAALAERGRTARTPAFTPPTREPLRPVDIDRLASLRNRFSGERIFVMGNGPSLNRTPLDLLDDEFVFGVNRVSLLFDRVNWRPTFFTAFDVRVVPDNRDEFAALDVPYKFFSARYKELMGERQNHYWYHTKGFYEGFEACFEPTVPYSGFGGGGTIVVIAVELAFYLGFREIYLIGTDASYTVPATVKQSGPDQFGDGVKLELESTADDDSNHFDPRYFGKGKKWHNPNVREMKIGFGRAAAYMERRGGILRNATVGGELDSVPRVDFESLF